MRCGKCTGNCGLGCTCKKRLGEEDLAPEVTAQMRERHRREDWMGTYYISIFFVLAVLTLALHPLVITPS